MNIEILVIKNIDSINNYTEGESGGVVEYKKQENNLAEREQERSQDGC